jgi:hypothetical protein
MISTKSKKKVFVFPFFNKRRRAIHVVWDQKPKKTVEKIFVVNRWVYDLKSTFLYVSHVWPFKPFFRGVEFFRPQKNRIPYFEPSLLVLNEHITQMFIVLKIGAAHTCTHVSVGLCQIDSMYYLSLVSHMCMYLLYTFYMN